MLFFITIPFFEKPVNIFVKNKNISAVELAMMQILPTVERKERE